MKIDYSCKIWIYYSKQLFKDFCLFHLQLTVELAYVFVQAVIYGGMIYAMIRFERTVTKFFCNLFFTYFTFFGMVTVATTPNQNIAAVVASAFYSMWNLFSGFFLPRTVSMYKQPFPLI